MEVEYYNQNLALQTSQFSLQADGNNAKMISQGVTFFICCLGVAAIIKASS